MLKAIIITAGLFASIVVAGTSACGRPVVPQGSPPETVLVNIIVEPEQRAASFNYEGQFFPQSVIVSVGGTVTWNNTDNKDHTVVSYDGLFNRRLPPGGSFSYTFTQNGTYKYHDELYDGMDGFVYVR